MKIDKMSDTELQDEIDRLSGDVRVMDLLPASKDVKREVQKRTNRIWKLDAELKRRRLTQ